MTISCLAAGVHLHPFSPREGANSHTTSGRPSSSLELVMPSTRTCETSRVPSTYCIIRYLSYP